MYLIYIDESGTSVKYNKDPKRFSLTGCIINEQDEGNQFGLLLID